MRAIVMVVLVLLTAGAIAADYHGLFGVRMSRTGDYLHLTFEFIDAQSRAPVADVHIACTRPMVRSACTETRGPGLGQTTITFAAYRVTRHSLLFSRELGHTLGDGVGMNLTFIPASHARATLTLTSDDPRLAGGRPQVVELTATTP